MRRQSLSLLLLLAPPAGAASWEAWVHDRVQVQRRAFAADAGGELSFKAPKPAGPIPGFTPPTSLAPLVRAVRPGVVNIATRNEGTSRSLGSGFVIDSGGLVVTNNHVIERAQIISVRLADGREFGAMVVGRDPSTDLAVLKLDDAKDVPVAGLGDSDLLEVGDWVVAIGNPFGLETSVTLGIISARERVIGVGPWDDFIQTNAPINPGNSGGPLFDMKGEVVGVTTAVVTQGQGIGFAVPINLVKELLPNLLSNGRVERGWLGLSIQEVVSGSDHASVVMDVFQGSPAQKAGIKPGDRIVSVGDKRISRYQQLLRRIALLQPGTEVKLGLLRDGKPVEAEATLDRRPALEVLKALATGGRIDALGLLVRELDRAVARQLGVLQGLRVEAVVPGSLSDIAGIAAGDLITEVNRAPVGNLKELSAALALARPGEPILLKYQRGDVSRYVALRTR